MARDMLDCTFTWTSHCLLCALKHIPGAQCTHSGGTEHVSVWRVCTIDCFHNPSRIYGPGSFFHSGPKLRNAQVNT